MPLIGTLGDLSLPNLVQLQCSEQTQAQVRLTRQGHQGMLVFAEGELIYATIGDKTGEDAVYELLTWEDGDFRVENENLTFARNVFLPWSGLLLEGLRLADEARAEHDATLEKTLRELRGKQGLRSALVAHSSGLVKADAKEKNTMEDAALVAFVASRAETISSIMGLGTFRSMTALTANDKVLVAKMDNNVLGCWLDARATPEQIKNLLTTLGITR